MQTRNADEVARELQRYADQVVTIVGDTKLTNPAVDTAPCEGKRGETRSEIRSTYALYQLPLPVSAHPAAFARLRDSWRANGWTITDDRSVGEEGRGTLSAEAPDNAMSVSVTSTKPPTMLALSINSECYHDPDVK